MLIVFEGSSMDQSYTSALETMVDVGKVLDSLYTKAK